MHRWEDFSWNYLLLLPIFPPSSHPIRKERKENTTIGWDDSGKIGNKNK